MTLRRLLLISVSALVLGAAAPLRAADFTCPDEITPTQTMAAPAGWTVFVDKANAHALLTRIELYDGPPEQLAQLEPDNGEDTDDGGDDMSAEVWTLAKSKHPLYMVCSYSDTSVRLTKPIGSGFKKCRVIEKSDDAVRASSGNILIDKLTCQ